MIKPETTVSLLNLGRVPGKDLTATLLLECVLRRQVFHIVVVE